MFVTQAVPPFFPSFIHPALLMKSKLFSFHSSFATNIYSMCIVSYLLFFLILKITNILQVVSVLLFSKSSLVNFGYVYQKKHWLGHSNHWGINFIYPCRWIVGTGTDKGSGTWRQHDQSTLRTYMKTSLWHRELCWKKTCQKDKLIYILRQNSKNR